MAQHQVEPVAQLGFNSKAHTVAGSAAKSTDDLATPGNYDSLADMDTRLLAISGTTFPQTRLDQMTQNDKIYALRLLDDAGTL
jgi:hypothetical protein